MRLFSKWGKQLALPDNNEALVTHLINLIGASVTIDFGANVGPFLQRTRAAGLGLSIVSFEPDTEAHYKLQKAVLVMQNGL